jgi:hypothetical protein
MLTQERIRELVEIAASRAADEDSAWGELKALGPDVVPFLAEAFPRTRKWQGRVSLVFHCIWHARISQPAVDLGLVALRDKSYMVRYRACGLLAYSLQTTVLPALRVLLDHPDSRTVEDASAAIAAIEHQNHHLFVDRSGSGRSFWVVNPEDEPQ